MKQLFLILFFLFCIIANNTADAQTYYWVGGSGDWSDVSHWTNYSNGPNTVYSNPPGASDVVIFDNNSFDSPNQTVTFDVGAATVKDLYWQNATNNPVFSGASTNDSLTIRGNFVLNPNMTYNYSGKLIFQGGDNDSIVSAGHSHSNDIVIETTGDTLTVTDALTTSGGIYFYQGGLFVDDRTITAAFFRSDFALSRTLNCNNTTFNLTGNADTTLYLRANQLTKTGINQVFNITNSSATNDLGIGTEDLSSNWGQLNLQNSRTRFFTSAYFETISSSNATHIGLAANTTLKTPNFNIDGNCDNYIELKGENNTSAVNNNNSIWNLSYYRLENVDAQTTGASYNAVNVFDDGGNTGWNITTDATAAENFFWIGGNGHFYDPAHWSATSGGPSLNCIPTENDTVYFDAASGLDSLFLFERITIASLDFSGLSSSLVISGDSDTLEFRKDLIGNSGLQFDWPGIIKCSNITLSNITSNGATWNNEFLTSGNGTLSFSDTYTNLQHIRHVSGTLDANSQQLTLGSFYSDDTLSARNINFTNATIEITGETYNVDATLLGTYSLSPSEIIFSNSSDNLLTFVPGTENLDVVRITNNHSLFVDVDSINYNLLDIKAGNTFIVKNGSKHVFESLNASASCDSLIVIKAKTASLQSAYLVHDTTSAWAGTINISSAIIDNVSAELPTEPEYIAANSILVNGSTGWTLTGSTTSGTYYWVGNSGNWSDIGNWSTGSGGTPDVSCVPSYGDTVIFDGNSFSGMNQVVSVDKEAYFNVMIWEVTQTDSVQLNLKHNLNAAGDVTLNPFLSIERTGAEERMNFSPLNYNSDFDPNAALVNVPIDFVSKTLNDSLSLSSALNNGDLNTITIYGGVVTTNGNDIKTGTIVITSSQTPSELYLGDSDIELTFGFVDYAAGASFLDAGTSHINVDYKNLAGVNFFLGNNHDFNAVELTLVPRNKSEVSGNLGFDSLTVHAGSELKITAGDSLNVVSYFEMNGTCTDSIFLSSSVPGTPYVLGLANDSLRAQCLNVKDADINSSSVNFGTYFSTDQGGNNATKWNFYTDVSTSANIGTLSNSCFGDTLSFSNASSAFQGQVGLLSESWDFGDGTSYQGDTTQHYYSSPGVYELVLTSIFANECSDSDTTAVSIIGPDAYLTTSYSGSACLEESVGLYASSDSSSVSYQFSINGSPVTPWSANLTGDTLNISTLSNNDSVTVQVDMNGCLFVSDTIYFSAYAAVTPTISATAATICEGTSVTFTGSNANLYKYFVNGVDMTAFSSSPFVTSSLSNGDQVYAIGKNSTTGCQDTSNVITMVVNALPTVTLTQTGASSICAGDLVTLTANSTIGTNFEFYVNGAIENSSASNVWDTTGIVNGDNLYVIAQSGAGCISTPSNSITYSVTPLPTPDLQISDSSICEGAEVTIQSNFALQYQFFVNGSPMGPLSPTPFISSSSFADGDVITVNGENGGCIGTSSPISMEVTPTPTTVLNSNFPLNTICFGQQVDFEANNSIATSYEFFVNGLSQGPPSGDSTFSTSTLSNGGNVSVETNLMGCTFTTGTTFTVNVAPNPSLLPSPSGNPSCEETDFTFTATDGDTYDYYLNGILQFSGTGPWLTNSLPVGSDTITVVATNLSNLCSSTSSEVVIDIIELPTTNLTSSSVVICNQDMANFTAISANAQQFQFYVNGTPQGLPSNNNIFNTNALNDGDVITVQGYNQGCANPGLDTISMTVNPNPTASITGGAALFCEGTSQIFTATQGTNYEFFVNGISQGAPSPTNTFNGISLGQGSYILSVEVTSNGCTDTDNMNLTVLTKPIVTFSGNNTLCSGETAIFTGSGAAIYEYFINGTTQGAGVNNVFSSNTLNDGDVVSLVGTSLNGCNSQNNPQITMTVNQTPAVTLTDDDADNLLCDNQTVTFTAIGGDLWEFFVNGFSVGPASATNIYITDSLTNGQIVSVLGTSNNGCSYEPGGTTFTVVSSPVVGLTNNGDTTLCIDSLSSISAFGATDYLFYINGAPQGTFSPNPNFNSLLSNGDIVTVEGMTNTCISAAPESVQYTVFQYPSVSLVSSDIDFIICADENVDFTGSGAMSYQFEIDGLPVGIGGAIFSTDQLEDGQTVTLTGFNGECPSDAPQVMTFTVNTMNLTANVTPSYMICDGDVLTLNLTGADEYEVFVNGISQAVQSPTSTYNLSGLTDGDAIASIGYSNITGCTQTFDETGIVQVFDAPAIDVFTSNVICEGDSTILVSNSKNGNQWYVDGTPIVGATDTSYTVVTSGDYTLEITNGGFGEVWSVGYNANGEFGNNTNLDNDTPSPAVGITGIAKIVSGGSHTAGLTNSNELYLWGENSSGQLGLSNFTSSNVPALVTAVPAIVDVAAGHDFTVAIDATGNLFAWGGNGSGQLGTGTTIVSNSPALIGGISDIVEVVAGNSHVIALKNDGTVWAVGNNDFGQLGLGNLASLSTFVQVPGLTNISVLGAGAFHSMAIDTGGNLYVWGNNSQGQLGMNDLNNRLSPTLSPLSDVRSISGGNAHTVFVTNNNKAYATGTNTFGQLGTGDFINRVSPIQLFGIDGVASAKAGAYHTLYRKNDGSIWGAGRNNQSQLGNLVPASIENISQLDGPNGVTYIDGGNESSHFVYGNSIACTSPIETITVQNAPQPTIVFANGELSTASTGASYEWFIDGIEIINSNNPTQPTSENGEYVVVVTYTNGCTSTSDPYYYNAAGIEEIVPGTLTLFPNPAKDQITIRASFEIRNIEVLDMVGRTQQIMNNLNSSEVNINTSYYSKGMYCVKITNASGKSALIKFTKVD